MPKICDLIAEKATGTLHAHGAPHVDKNSSMEAAEPIDEPAPCALPPLVVQDDLGISDASSEGGQSRSPPPRRWLQEASDAPR